MNLGAGLAIKIDFIFNIRCKQERVHAVMKTLWYVAICSMYKNEVHSGVAAVIYASPERPKVLNFFCSEEQQLGYQQQGKVTPNETVTVKQLLKISFKGRDFFSSN